MKMSFPIEDLMFLLQVIENGINDEGENSRYKKLKDKIRGVE